MEYYHIRITRESNRSHDEIRLDVSRDILESQFLIPYRKGRAIVTGGTNIPTEDVERIRITRTDVPSEVIRPRVESERASSGMVTFIPDDWHIADSGEDVTDQFITAPPGTEVDESIAASTHRQSVADPRSVFVVHGRNSEARDALFSFLRAIGLTPIEWSQAVDLTGKASPYVGEILDTVFSRAPAVVVLLTPDDEVQLKERFHGDSEPPHERGPFGQARPNVLFEAGMAMARSEERTILAELGDLRPFSDVAGRHVIRLDNTSPRRQQLAQRLRTAGCAVNLNGTDWHSVGNFEAAVVEEGQTNVPSHET